MGDLAIDLSGVSDDDMSQGSGGGWVCKPDGHYRVMITEASVKPTKAGTGQCLWLKHVFLDPEHQGDFQLDFVNVRNPSVKAQEIGQAQLKCLAIATGHPTPNFVDDSKDLMNKPFYLRLYAEEDSDSKYADSNGFVQQVGGYISSTEYQQSHQGEAAPQANTVEGPPVGNEPPPHTESDIPF